MMNRVWEHVGLTDRFLRTFWRDLWGSAISRRTCFFIRWLLTEDLLSSCELQFPAMILPVRDAILLLSPSAMLYGLALWSAYMASGCMPFV